MVVGGAELVSEPKYMRAALTNQYNVILLGGALAFSAALASWRPLMAAVLAESLWLLIGPRLGAFRRASDARISRQREAKALSALAPEYAERVTALQLELNEIEGLCASRADLSPDQRHEVARRVPTVLQTFIEVCGMQQRLKQAVARAPLVELQAEMAGLHQALSTETDLGVRASLRRALNVAERRLKQIESNDAAARALDVALATLLTSVAMLKEGAAGFSGTAELCAEIDAVCAQLTRAASLEAQRDDELGAAPASVLPPASS